MLRSRIRSISLTAFVLFLLVAVCPPIFVLRTDAQEPKKGAAKKTTALTGFVEASESVRMFALVSGFLKEKTVDIGDVVKKGQVLAVLDGADIEAAEGRYRGCQASSSPRTACEGPDRWRQGRSGNHKLGVKQAEDAAVGGPKFAQFAKEIAIFKVLAATAAIEQATAAYPSPKPASGWLRHVSKKRSGNFPIPKSSHLSTVLSQTVVALPASMGLCRGAASPYRCGPWPLRPSAACSHAHSARPRARPGRAVAPRPPYQRSQPP